MREASGKFCSAGIQLIDFRRHDEITFGQAVDLVRPQSDFDFTPGEQNVWMMTLFLCDFADFIHEGKCLFEVKKVERSSNVVLVDYLPVCPLRHLLVNFR